MILIPKIDGGPSHKFFPINPVEFTVNARTLAQHLGGLFAPSIRIDYRTMSRYPWIFIACTLSLGVGSSQAQTSPIPAADYTVARSWRVGGNAGWETLVLQDNGTRLFVS